MCESEQTDALRSLIRVIALEFLAVPASENTNARENLGERDASRAALRTYLAGFLPILVPTCASAHDRGFTIAMFGDCAKADLHPHSFRGLLSQLTEPLPCPNPEPHPILLNPPTPARQARY